MRKLPRTVIANVGCERILKLGCGDLAARDRGRLDLMRRLAMMQRNRIMKPITRVAQANPTFGIKDCRSNGNTIPPKAHPVAAIPVALPRRRLKKWPIAAMEGVKRREVPTPPLMPKTTMKCQYSKQVSSERLFTRIRDNDFYKPRARTWKLQRKRFQGG